MTSRLAWDLPGGRDTTIRQLSAEGSVGSLQVRLAETLWAAGRCSASAVNTYVNAYANGKPTLSFPSPFGTAATASASTLDFNYAITPIYKDPTVQQWNLTVEQDLGFNTGFRVSYAGSHGQNLGLEGDANQLPYGTGTPTNAKRPFPSLNSIYQVRNLASSNYNAMTLEANHRMTRGLQFQGSYTFARICRRRRG